MCERADWELLLKTKRKELPNDRKLINKLWSKVSSFDQDIFCKDLSNRHTFRKISVLSPLTHFEDFSDPLNSLKTGNVISLFPYFSGVKKS